METKLSQSIEIILNEIAKVADLMNKRGWAEKNAGNISYDLTDDFNIDYNPSKEICLKHSYSKLSNRLFYISASGSRMRNLAKHPLLEGLILKINKNGDAYSVLMGDKNLKPSSELPSHLGIHQSIKERNETQKVVLHTHATELIALTQNKDFKSSEKINDLIWNMHPETMMFIPKGIGFVPFILPGTQEIADATIKMFKKYDIVLWEKHGVFAIGESLLDTFDSIDIVCKSVKIWLMCRSAGFEPEGFTREQMQILKTSFTEQPQLLN